MTLKNSVFVLRDRITNILKSLKQIHLSLSKTNPPRQRFYPIKSGYVLSLEREDDPIILHCIAYDQHQTILKPVKIDRNTNYTEGDAIEGIEKLITKEILDIVDLEKMLINHL